MTPLGGIEYVNGVPPAVLTMAGAHRAWAARFMPWLLWSPR